MVLAEYVLIGMIDILLVLLAVDLLDMSDSGPGIVNSALGIGGILGALATLVLIGRKRLGPAIVLGDLAAGAPFALAALAGTPVAAMALIAVSGAGKVFFTWPRGPWCSVCCRTGC